MDKMYENIVGFIDHEYEPGIGAEIRSFMDYQKERIKSYDLSFNQLENQFELEIVMNEYSKISANQLFFDLLLLIEYPFATFYNTKTESNALKYNLVSYTSYKKGFVLDLSIN